jgi:hypothetical protein
MTLYSYATNHAIALSQLQTPILIVHVLSFFAEMQTELPV